MNVYYNDIDPYCCKVLRKQIENGNLPGGYVDERDIREVRATDLAGYQHIHLFAGIGGFPLGLQWANYPSWLRTLSGGFPCQDISNSGKRAGITGERSGLWKQMYRLIQESTDCYGRFDFILVENVAALLGRGLDTVLIDLAQAGYDAEWTCIRASDFGAPHLRERVFIVAYPYYARPSSEWRGLPTWKTDTTSASSTAPLAYTQCRTPSLEEHRSSGQGRQSTDTSQPTPVRQEDGAVSTEGIGASSEELADSTRRRTAAIQQPRQLCGLEFSGEEMAYPTIKGLEGQQWQELQGGGVRSTNGYQTMADTESEQGRGICQRWLQSNIDASGVGLADANRQGLQIRDGSADQRGAFTTTYRRGSGQSEPLFCRGIARLSPELDIYRWPARPGEEQYSWEPGRIVTEKVPHRVQRLKALGNSIVPHCVEYVARCILASIEVEQVESDGAA